mmetsp:Transcript_23372/g.54621  ORF Transcript_23372/g.54621 Transcript_23372/m.54621 type:complete len:201 (+) Transcript_23372:1136-1738(+)
MVVGVGRRDEVAVLVIEFSLLGRVILRVASLLEVLLVSWVHVGPAVVGNSPVAVLQVVHGAAGGNAQVAIEGKNDVTHDADLQTRVKNHVAEHRRRKKGPVAAVGLAVEELLGGTLSRQRQRRERVHDEINPQQVDGLERRLLQHAGAQHSDHNRRKIHCQLEHKELADVIVDRASPHHCFDDRAEVVVHQDDIRSLLGH